MTERADSHLLQRGAKEGLGQITLRVFFFFSWRVINTVLYWFQVYSVMIQQFRAWLSAHRDERALYPLHPSPHLPPLCVIRSLFPVLKSLVLCFSLVTPKFLTGLLLFDF